MKQKEKLAHGLKKVKDLEINGTQIVWQFDWEIDTAAKEIFRLLSSVPDSKKYSATDWNFTRNSLIEIQTRINDILEIGGGIATFFTGEETTEVSIVNDNGAPNELYKKLTIDAFIDPIVTKNLQQDLSIASNSSKSDTNSIRNDNQDGRLDSIEDGLTGTGFVYIEYLQGAVTQTTIVEEVATFDSLTNTVQNRRLDLIEVIDEVVGTVEIKSNGYIATDLTGDLTGAIVGSFLTWNRLYRMDGLTPNPATDTLLKQQSFTVDFASGGGSTIEAKRGLQTFIDLDIQGGGNPITVYSTFQSESQPYDSLRGFYMISFNGESGTGTSMPADFADLTNDTQVAGADGRLVINELDDANTAQDLIIASTQSKTQNLDAFGNITIVTNTVDPTLPQNVANLKTVEDKIAEIPDPIAIIERILIPPSATTTIVLEDNTTYMLMFENSNSFIVVSIAQLTHTIRINRIGDVTPEITDFTFFTQNIGTIITSAGDIYLRDDFNVPENVSTTVIDNKQARIDSTLSVDIERTNSNGNVYLFKMK